MENKTVTFKELSFFFKCKGVLSYSLWFGDYTFLRSKLGFNWSKDKIDELINSLIDQGLIVKRSRSGKIEYYFKKYRKYKIDYSIDIDAQLTVYFLKKKEKQFKFMSDLNKKVSYSNSKNVKLNKRAYKKYNGRLVRGSIEDKFNISYSGVSKLLGVSKPHAQKLLRKSLSLGLIRTRKNTKLFYKGSDASIVLKYKPETLLWDSSNYYYLIKGKIIQVSPNYYTFNS